MTDVRCPMCGKTNPTDAEKCGYCEARLQPLTGSQDDFTWEDAGNGEQEEDIPDWLKELRPPNGEEIEEREEDFGEAFGEERFSQVFQEESQPDTSEDSAFPIETLDDEGEQGQDSGAHVSPDPEDSYPPIEAQTAGDDVVEDDLPDWFSTYAGEKEPELPSQTEYDEPKGAELTEEDPILSESAAEENEEDSNFSDDPEWLVKIRKRHEVEEAEKSRQNQDSLEWLSDPPFPEVQPPRDTVSNLQEEQTAAEEDYGLLSPENEDDTALESGESAPDWLTRLEKASQEPVDSEVGDENLPDMERDYESEELPNWLAKFSEEKSEEGETARPEADEEIAPGDLPDWLEAMRPIDSAAPSIPLIGEEDARPEKIGPLAGLKAVIPAEPEFGHFKKPPVYSIKLHVTDHQQAHAGLLESLLEGEEDVNPISPRPRITSQVLLRLLITFVLITVILLPRWFDFGGAGLPAAIIEESSVVQRQIDQMPAGAPVLIGFDFEPGLAAELDLAADIVIRELWERNANIVLVSTLPVGPVNAERYFKSLAVDAGESGPAYVNLGFIAGGPAGLRGFAENPSLVLPFSMESISIWNRAPFSGIETAADFAMLVVITENPETARAWIEQVRMTMDGADMPFILVVSAQAEPLVRPYYAGGMPGQVSGLLVGWAGGAAMESLVGRPGPVTANWSMFGMGLTAAAVLLLVGGLISLIILFQEKRTDSDRDEDVL